MKSRKRSGEEEDRGREEYWSERRIKMEGKGTGGGDITMGKGYEGEEEER